MDIFQPVKDCKIAQGVAKKLRMKQKNKESDFLVYYQLLCELIY